MNRDIDKIISRLSLQVGNDRRYQTLKSDVESIRMYVERDQERKDALLNDYLVMLHFLSANKIMPKNEKAQRLLAALSYSIAQILGDYDYSVPGGLKKAKDRANKRSESILKAMAAKAKAEEVERKQQGRSNMGRSKTPTISRIKRRATAVKKEST